MRRLAVLLAACTGTRAPAPVDVQALLDAPASIGGVVSPDGTKLLFRSDRDGVPEPYLADVGGHELLEVDLATGDARAISDPTPQMLTAGAYSADGTRIYVATDHGSERHTVEAVDRDSLRVVATYVQDAPATAEISAIVPSPRGDRIAIMVDAGNHTTVRLLDATTLAAVADAHTGLGLTTVGINSETRVRLGTGVFTDDGARFTIGVSLPDAPDDVYLVDTATGDAALAHHDARPALAKLPRVTSSIETVASFDGLAIPVNVHLPEGGKHAVVVWLH